MWIRRVGASVRAVAYSPDGRTVYTVESLRATAWDIAAREPTRLFSHFRNGALGVSYARHLYHAGERYLLVECYTRWRAWDMEDKQEVKIPKFGEFGRPVGPTSSAFRFVSPRGDVIRAHDLATGKTTTLLEKPDGLKKLARFAFSPDERQVLVLDDYNDGALVTLATGKSVSVPRPPGFCATYALHFTPNGTLVWVAGNHIHVRSAKNPNKRIMSHPWPYNVFALHPSAPMFAALDADWQFTLFSLETGAVLRTFKLEIGRRVQCACFSPDGLTCAVGGSNKQFAVFDVDL